MKPDYGEPAPIYIDDPGVRLRRHAAIGGRATVKPEFCITHYPGYW